VYFSKFLQNKSLTRFIYGVLGVFIGIIIHDLLSKNDMDIEGTLKLY